MSMNRHHATNLIEAHVELGDPVAVAVLRPDVAVEVDRRGDGVRRVDPRRARREVVVARGGIHEVGATAMLLATSARRSPTRFDPDRTNNSCGFQ
jgi:hypothetical protein